MKRPRLYSVLLTLTAIYSEKTSFLKLFGDGHDFIYRIFHLRERVFDHLAYFPQILFASHEPYDKSTNIAESQNALALKKSEMAADVLSDFKPAFNFRHKLFVHDRLLSRMRHIHCPVKTRPEHICRRRSGKPSNHRRRNYRTRGI